MGLCSRALSAITSIGRDGAEGAEHDAKVAFATLWERLTDLSPLPPDQWRVLDIGCGYTYPNVLLMRDRGVDVVGLDVLGAFYRDGWGGRWREEPNVPFPRRLWRCLKARRRGRSYYRVLADLMDGPVEHEALELVRYDGSRFPFEDASFNIVISNAVLEHVADLPLFASEVKRVLVPDGVFDMVWHNYFSWSGNHLPDAVNEKHPWGHLTGETSPPDTAGLNRALPEAIEGALADKLNVIRCVAMDRRHRIADDPGYEPEAVELLAGELREQLAAQYPEELLTSRAYLIQGMA